MEYERKIDNAISLLRSIPQDGPIELCYSGGKDSDIILELAKMAGIPFEAIYKQTTIDPPGTIAHAKSVGATIVRPKYTFFELVERKGIPSRFKRFCCKFLKEYKIYDRAVQGIRRCESVKRQMLYKEPEVCRVYGRNDKARIYYPILEWTDEDVERFVAERGIKCHNLYYDDDGKFRVERRLGCLGCPMSRAGMREEFLRYPRMLELWLRALRRYRETHPNTRTVRVFKNEYDEMFNAIFCKSMEDYESRMTIPVFPVGTTERFEWLERYFKVDIHHIPKFPDGVHTLDTELFLTDYFGIRNPKTQVK